MLHKRHSLPSFLSLEPSREIADSLTIRMGRRAWSAQPRQSVRDVTPAETRTAPVALGAFFTELRLLRRWALSGHGVNPIMADEVEDRNDSCARDSSNVSRIWNRASNVCA